MLAAGVAIVVTLWLRTALDPARLVAPERVPYLGGGQPEVHAWSRSETPLRCTGSSPSDGSRQALQSSPCSRSRSQPWPRRSCCRAPQELTFFDTCAADDVAVWAKLIVLVVGAVTVGLSVEWFATDPWHGGYYALLLLTVPGAVVLAGAADLMSIILGLLLSSATGYVLAAAFHRTNARPGEAAIKYYLLGALTNAALV